MALKEILRKSFAAYRRNFGKLLIPILILQLAILLPLLFFTMPGTISLARALLVTFSSFSLTGEGSDTVFYVLIYVLLVLLFLSPLVVNNTVCVVESSFWGKRIRFRESMGTARKKYWASLKTYFAAIVTGTPVIFAIVLMLSSSFIRGFDLSALNTADIVKSISSILLITLYMLGTVFLPYIVVSEGKEGFAALWASFRYIYRGDFIANLLRLAAVGAILGLAMLGINWLSQLPFMDLFFLYLQDPRAAMQEPLMVFAIILSVTAIFLVALILPFWYAFSYNTYRIAKSSFEEKHGALEDF